MANTIFLKEEFKKWLIESQDLTPDSANSYLSYVSAVNNHFELDNQALSTIVEHYHKAKQQGKLDSAINSVFNALFEEDICNTTNRPQSTINKWKSALFQYQEFLYEVTEEGEYLKYEDDISSELIEPLEWDSLDDKVQYLDYRDFDEGSEAIPVEKVIKKKLPHKKYCYKKDELLKKFGLRLITQDRFYGDIFFPISYIKRLLYIKGERKFFDKWILDHLNEIVVHTENEATILKNISEFKISIIGNCSEVHALIGDTLTSVWFPFSGGKNRFLMNGYGLSGIAIDHLYPMKKILIDTQNELPQLLKITQFLKEISGKKSSTAKEYKALGSRLLVSPKSNEVDIEGLKAELNILKSKTKLQLMDKGANLSKSAN